MQRTKITLKKDKIRELTLPDFKTCEAIVIKIV